MKKLTVTTLFAVMALVLTACGATAATQAPATEAAQFTCALITPNPLGDRSFIDASARGIERANKELPVKCDIIETNGVGARDRSARCCHP